MAPSTLYTTLKQTATDFINSSKFDSATQGVDAKQVHAMRTEDYEHSYGHKFAVKGTPLAGKFDTEGFLRHIGCVSRFYFVHLVWRLGAARRCGGALVRFRVSDTARSPRSLFLLLYFHHISPPLHTRHA